MSFCAISKFAKHAEFFASCKILCKLFARFEDDLHCKVAQSRPAQYVDSLLLSAMVVDITLIGLRVSTSLVVAHDTACVGVGCPADDGLSAVTGVHRNVTEAGSTTTVADGSTLSTPTAELVCCIACGEQPYADTAWHDHGAGGRRVQPAICAVQLHAHRRSVLRRHAILVFHTA